MTPPPDRTFVGIDVAADTFTASWARGQARPTRPITLPQSPAGYATLHTFVSAEGADPDTILLVLEATACSWIGLAVTLHSAGLAVAVVDTAHVYRHFRAQPRRPRAERLDAQLLVRYAQQRQLAAWTPPPGVYDELRQRYAVRDVLRALHEQAQTRRLNLPPCPVAVAGALEPLDAVISDLDARVRTLDREITVLLRDRAWPASAGLR